MRRWLDEWPEQAQSAHPRAGAPPPKGSGRATAPAPAPEHLRELILHERFMFENYIGGRWCRPAAGQYLAQRSAIGGGPGGSVARATADDIAAACTAAGQAAGDWARRGRAVRRAELGQVPARIAPQALALAMAQHWDQDWDQHWDQGASVRALDSPCAERQAALLRDIVRTLPSPPAGRQRPVSLGQAPEVARLACAADAAQAELLRTLLPLLYDGRTAVVLLLYQDARHLPVRLLQLLGIIAAAMPGGVLNVLTGLGLEAGVALMRERCDAVAPAPRPPELTPVSLNS
jgi:aldehyde dehydrogenase